MTENKRFVPIFDRFDKRVVGAKDNGVIISFMDMFDLLNGLHKENKKLKRENESLNSELLRLDKELFCQDCLTCRHSKSIDITVRCANGNGITDYQMNCDFYEIDEEWVE